ncbi:MAG: hypothetical protein LBG99_00880 [Propionibacteriaceae bacterium]|jgi:hypothetical protein|nr:hypothetical protein [Propionibacteriaceae bacterium]
MTADHSLLNSWATAHTALLVDGQARLSDIVGTSTPDWDLNLTTGMVSVGGTRLQCAFLGWVSEDNKWTWAWADPSVDSEALGVHRGLPLKKFGQETGLWEFTEPTFSIEGIVDLGMTPGATIAMVASPQIMGSAIFSAPKDGSRHYLVITDPLLTLEAPSAFTTPKVLTSALAYGLGNHRDIVTVYAAAYQLQVEQVGDTIILGFDDGSHLDVVFDETGQLSDMQGRLPADLMSRPSE